MNVPEFIKQANIMDKEQWRPDHPDYDGSTLFIPVKDFMKLTPNM